MEKYEVLRQMTHGTYSLSKCQFESVNKEIMVPNAVNNPI